MRIKYIRGKKSKSDKILLLSAHEEPISFKSLAQIFARIVKNEQIITTEIPHYSHGADLLRDYFEYITQKNWIIVPDDRIDKELNLLYHKKFRGKNATI